MEQLVCQVTLNSHFHGSVRVALNLNCAPEESPQEGMFVYSVHVKQFLQGLVPCFQGRQLEIMNPARFNNVLFQSTWCLAKADGRCSRIGVMPGNYASNF